MVPSRSNRFAALLLAMPALLLTGCGLGPYPTQDKPICSWNSQVPSSAARVCSTVFGTLRSLTRAEQTGDNTTVHRLVSTPAVANRIIAYGQRVRAQHATDLHVVPSITLEQTDQGLIGAAFYILGNKASGKINAPQTVYLRLKGTRAVVVEDQPAQDW